MKLKQTPELQNFLSTYFADTDQSTDIENTQKFARTTAIERVRQVTTQVKQLLSAPELPLEELGMEANRWFAEPQEAYAWLNQILHALEQASGSAAGGQVLVVKDSNGALLAEGDSVQVIKDLKVKGGTSDLKRGTLIKKIHLIEDSEAIECRVDGSTLVLKTCFLKKA